MYLSSQDLKNHAMMFEKYTSVGGKSLEYHSHGLKGIWITIAIGRSWSV